MWFSKIIDSIAVSTKTFLGSLLVVSQLAATSALPTPSSAPLNQQPTPSPILTTDSVQTQINVATSSGATHDLVKNQAPTTSQVPNGSPVKNQAPYGDLVPTPTPKATEGEFIVRGTQVEDMATVSEINSAVNQYRSTKGLSALKTDDQLCALAQTRAQEITSDFSHDGFLNRVNQGKLGYLNYQAIGENLWQGKFSANHIVESGWSQSEGHQKNLVGEWTKGCAGVSDTSVSFVFMR